jgi:hypothetical protein
MTNLPRLFTDKGELIDVATSGMDAGTLARLEAIRVAYTATKEAAAVLADAYAEVNAALEAVKNTEEYFAARWPKQTFQDLWRENFGGGPRNRMQGRA